MKKKINLYIVCSTRNDVLKDQKEKIIKKCQSLKEQYAETEDGCEITINAVGYDDPENENIVSKKFIDNNANIVVFLFDKESDKKQRKRIEDNLDKSVRKYRQKHLPEILVYLPHDAEKNISEKTKKLLKNDSINIKRLLDTNLEEVVGHNIQTYVDSYEMLHQVHQWAIFKPWIPVFIVLIISLLAHGKIQDANDKYIRESQKRILIAGGGSAKHYIEENFNILKDPYWIYAPVASGNAYRLLMEETAMETSEKHYYTIILSAGETGDTSFLRNNKAKTDSVTRMKEIEKFRKFGVIIGIHMGMDTLVVYCSDNISLGNNGSTLSKAEMDSVYKKWGNNIYTTNETSGTLKAYNELIGIDIKPTKIFYSSEIIDDTTWIAFGSKYYYPKNAVKKYVISDTNVKPKQIYVYFIKYKDQKEDKYFFPDEERRFLKKGLGFDDEIINRINDSLLDDRTKILFDFFCLDSNCTDSNHYIKLYK